MALGLLISQVLRFSVADHFVDYEHDPKSFDKKGILKLDFFAAALAVGLIITTVVRHWLSGQVQKEQMNEVTAEVYTRTTTIIQNLFGMTAAWTLLWAIRWRFLARWTEVFDS